MKLSRSIGSLMIGWYVDAKTCFGYDAVRSSSGDLDEKGDDQRARVCESSVSGDRVSFRGSIGEVGWGRNNGEQETT